MRGRLGLSASCNAGTRFTNVLVGKQQGTGLKPAEEGLILLFLGCNSRFNIA
jgi:hypothetical protein